MDLIAEAGLLFGRAHPIVRPDATESAAVAGPSELADGKREAVHDKEPAAWHHERRGEFLP